VILACEVPLDLGLISAANEDQIAAAEALVDVSLHRSTADWGSHDVAPYLQDLGQRTFDTMSAAAVGGSDSTSRALDAAAAEGLREEYIRIHSYSEDIARSTIAAARSAERRRVARTLNEQAAQNCTPAATSQKPQLVLRRVAGALRRRFGARKDAS
jgi:hypothetical protein